jgi:hypothetical protein
MHLKTAMSLGLCATLLGQLTGQIGHLLGLLQILPVPISFSDFHYPLVRSTASLVHSALPLSGGKWVCDLSWSTFNMASISTTDLTCLFISTGIPYASSHFCLHNWIDYREGLFANGLSMLVVWCLLADIQLTSIWTHGAVCPFLFHWCSLHTKF